MCYRNESPKSRQTYKLGVWTASRREPNRVVLYSAHTKRIFTPRRGDRIALDFAKNVPSLGAAVDRVQEIAWSGEFAPVERGWE